MSQNNNPEDIFQNFREGLNEFGKKVGSFVEDVMSGEPLRNEGDVRIRTDIYQDGDFYVIELELPGMSKAEVSIQIHDGVLQVKGNKKAVSGSESFRYERSERQFGPFIKTFTLPVDVELENIKAKYESGVLAIKFPRPRPVAQESFDNEDDGTSINID
ncbi:MAG: Hsp20/alpha crystallin family protein [Bacteroidia bacterium]|nr:Hsp20/alpha crystallin family protein [Bacteroidia bacterium]